MVGDLEVSPIYPPNRTVCPASPSLQWAPWAAVPHLLGRWLTATDLRYYAPLRLPSAPLGSLRFLGSLPDTLSAPLLCVPLPVRGLPGAAGQPAPLARAVPCRQAGEYVGRCVRR